MQVINQRLRYVNLSSVVDHLAQVAQSCLNPLFYLYNRYLVLTDYNMITLKQIVVALNVYMYINNSLFHVNCNFFWVEV